MYPALNQSTGRLGGVDSTGSGMTATVPIFVRLRLPLASTTPSPCVLQPPLSSASAPHDEEGCLFDYLGNDGECKWEAHTFGYLYSNFLMENTPIQHTS